MDINNLRLTKNDLINAIGGDMFEYTVSVLNSTINVLNRAIAGYKIETGYDGNIELCIEHIEELVNVIAILKKDKDIPTPSSFTEAMSLSSEDKYKLYKQEKGKEAI